jgi:glutathione S-transferase
MLTLYYAPGACSMAAHIVLEESGEPYEPRRVDLANGEQRTEAYLKINPQGRVPALRLDNGEPLAENTAILPYLGKRFGLWPSDPIAETKALSLVGFFAASVPSGARPYRPARAICGRSLRVSHAQGDRAQGFSRLSAADRWIAGRTRWSASRAAGRGASELRRRGRFTLNSGRADRYQAQPLGAKLGHWPMGFDQLRRHAR